MNELGIMIYIIGRDGLSQAQTHYFHTVCTEIEELAYTYYLNIGLYQVWYSDVSPIFTYCETQFYLCQIFHEQDQILVLLILCHETLFLVENAPQQNVQKQNPKNQSQWW